MSQRHGTVIQFKVQHGMLSLGYSKRSGVQGHAELRRHRAILLGTVPIPMNPMPLRGCPICRTLGAYVSLSGLSWGFISCHVAPQPSFPEACSSRVKRREGRLCSFPRLVDTSCMLTGGWSPLILLLDAFVYKYACGFKDSVMYSANAYVAIMYSCVHFSD